MTTTRNSTAGELKIMMPNDGNESGISSEQGNPETLSLVGEDVEESALTKNNDDQFDGILQRGEDVRDGPTANNNRNGFQIRRNISMGMYDVALLMANVSQLKTLLDSDSTKHVTTVLVLLTASISLHILSAILLYILFVLEKVDENIKIPKPNEKKCNEEIQTTMCSFCSRNQSVCYCWHMIKIDCVATFFVFVVTVLNVFITAFMTSK